MCRGRLTGRVAIVTGAGGGIGQAVARLFAAEGAGVVMADVRADACQAAAAQINRAQINRAQINRAQINRAGASAGAGGRAIGCRLDVTREADWAEAIRTARRRFGYPTILVNGAGTLALPALETVTEAEWARVVDVCQRGTWLGMRATIPVIMAGGGGAVVNLASIFGLVGSGVAFAYHAAKGAVRAMTAAAAVEYAGRGVRVNAVYPGLVETPMTGELPEQFVGEFVRATPMRRQGEPAEVARAVLFLASDDGSFVTGSELVVDGGYTAR